MKNVVLQDFNPEKYSELSQIMCAVFSSTTDPVKLLEWFVVVFTLLEI